MRRSLYSDAEIIAAYEEHGSVWKAGKALGLSGQQVHTRLQPYSVVRPINVFTDQEKDRLRRDYVVYRSMGKVAQLAEEMGRTVQFLSRQARALGLTNHSYPKPFASKWKYMTEDAAAVIWSSFKECSLTLGQFCAKHGFDDEGFKRTMVAYFGDEWEHVIEAKAPRETMYRRGRRLEYRARDELRKLGYFVLRSPASRSPIDLVAIRRGEVLFCQAKLSGVFPVREWNELFDLACSVGAVPVLVSKPTGRGTVYQRLLARKDGSKHRQPCDPFQPGEVDHAHTDEGTR